MVEFENIISRHRRGIFRVVIEQRTDARERMDDVGALKLTHAISIDGAEKIQNLVVTGRDAIGPAVVGNIRGPDQTEIALIGIDENDPAIVVLKQIGLRPGTELRPHDVAALDEANAMTGVLPRLLPQDMFDPWTGRVHNAAR